MYRRVICKGWKEEGRGKGQVRKTWLHSPKMLGQMRSSWQQQRPGEVLGWLAAVELERLCTGLRFEPLV